MSHKPHYRPASSYVQVWLEFPAPQPVMHAPNRGPSGKGQWPSGKGQVPSGLQPGQCLG